MLKLCSQSINVFGRLVDWKIQTISQVTKTVAEKMKKIPFHGIEKVVIDVYFLFNF